MKTKNIEILLTGVLLVVIVGLLYMVYNEPPQPQPEPQQTIFQFPVAPQRTRQPEFRQPPLRTYRPRRFQQVGLITSDDETLPLYGKESEIYNNRWNYYTTTPGDQIYSIPVSSGTRDCTEDIGCDELFDNQSVSVFGKEGVDFQTKMYRIDQFPYSLDM